MKEPSVEPAGDERDAEPLPPAPEPVSIDLSAAEGLPKSAQRRMWSASLLAAFSAHALILIGATWTPSLRSVGAGGQELEAIAIDIVSSKVLESRLAGAQPDAAAPELVDHAAPGAAPSQASMATVDQMPAEPEPEPQPAAPTPDLVIPEAKQEEPPPEPDEIALAIADEQPEKPDDQQPEVEPERDSEPQPQSAAPSQGSEASEAADEGGAVARGMDLVETPGQQAAAASPGVANEYAKTVIETLARRKPRATAGVRGTVRISFKVSASGDVQDARVLRSSGRKVLDEAALVAVRSAKFPAPPPALASAQLNYEVPYIFR